MNDRPNATTGPEPSTLFIISFRHRDELTQVTAKAGWHPVAARRAVGAELRFVSSGAAVAVVDARGAMDEALGAIRSLADPVEANAAALLVLLSRRDVERLDEVHLAGATHYLAAPFSDAELRQALRFSARHAERSGGATLRRKVLGNSEALSWTCASGELHLSAPLAKRYGVEGTTMTPSAGYRLLDPLDRPAARAARRRLKQGHGSTAFSHRLPDGGRVAHHLISSERGGTGYLESLEGVDDPSPFLRRDPLTGLPDGSAARRWVGSKLSEGATLGLLLVGLDQMQMANNHYGRSGGDALLQAAARRIQRAVQESRGAKAWVARVAGTEFLIAVPDASHEQLVVTAAAAKNAVETRFAATIEMAPLSASIGGVIGRGGQASDALRQASAALAEARQLTSGAIRIFGDAEGSALSRPLRLADDLADAIAEGHIETLFQPIVCIADARIDGVEALSRWQHPELGSLGADELFAAADRAQLLAPLAAHIQRQALELAASWPEELNNLRLSLNVTAGEIMRADFASEMLARIDASGFSRTRVTLELTEEGLVEDLGTAAAALAELRRGGCRVAADDFGTGYSSLAYLKALPLDYLKLDKRFSEDIAGSPRDRIVVRSVIEMARSLGLGVVAEGVETEEQLALLAAEGCTLYQGFLCSEPVGVEALAALIRRSGEARPQASPIPATAATRHSAAASGSSSRG